MFCKRTYNRLPRWRKQRPGWPWQQTGPQSLLFVHVDPSSTSVNCWLKQSLYGKVTPAALEAPRLAVTDQMMIDYRRPNMTQVPKSGWMNARGYKPNAKRKKVFIHCYAISSFNILSNFDFQIGLLNSFVKKCNNLWIMTVLKLVFVYFLEE